MVKTSKTSKVLSALQSGKSLTPAQIQGQYKIQNPHDVAYRLRRQGHCIYTTKRELWDGRVASEYTIGQPTPEMVALAAQVCARSFFA